jgi:hypothetical protein
MDVALVGWMLVPLCPSITPEKVIWGLLLARNESKSQ